jgi:dienelactone hydrolase
MDGRIVRMADVVLFHHVQGLTDGVLDFADRLRAEGHEVHTPDLLEGQHPGTVEAGVARMNEIGDETLEARVEAAIAELPDDVVYAGFSWGAAQAQRLAQTRSGARGALLYEACVPLSGDWAFGPWPDGVAVQIHGMEQDPFFGLEGDIDAARELVATVGSDLAELFVYSGDQHLFTDSSLASYDAEATALVVDRSLALLRRLG